MPLSRQLYVTAAGGLPPASRRPAAMDETQLILRTARGDQAAFDALYAEHHSGIYRYALAVSGQPALAEEAVHDVFLAVIGGKAQYSPSRGAVAPFLYGIARNVVRQKVRAAASGQATGSALLLDSVASKERSAPERLEADAERAELWAAIRTLPENFREAIVLCDIQQHSYAAAAELTGQPVGTIRSRLHRARQMLRRRLLACPPALVNAKRNP